MTTVAHVLSATYITLRVAKITPSEVDYIIPAIISAAVLDFDHLFYLIRDKKFFQSNGYGGNLHKARSPFHELVGFLTIGLGMFIISFFNSKLALTLGLPAMIHLIEDMVVGISMPFNPVDKTEIHLLPQKKNIKIFLDISTIIIFGILWIKYLNGQN